jgi:Vault protein inter-alpha-trypsin domain/von Willebrand factor type A domain/FecR protein
MKPDITPDQDGVLERNVTTLLETGGEPPRIADTARARSRAHLVEKHGAAARRRSPLIAVGLGLAATAAAAAIVTRVVGGGDSGGGGGHGASVVAEGGKLADGTSWLTQPGARVDVLAARRVRVTGAALLDVTPGAPFVVETAAGTIEVLGTRFLVEASAERTSAAVVRGSVKLASPGGQVLLHAGEQGVAEPGRPPTRGPAPRLSHLVSWAENARAKDETPVVPLRNGTLFAREPNRPGVPESPLPIQKLAVDVVVENQVARVALDQTFHNPAPQVMEGMYRFAIPPDASLQRLAMYVNGTLTESAVVERMAARRIYEDVVYRRLDPALLEWAGTGRLALRVYPLPAHEDKRLLLAYTQSLPRLYNDWSLEVPLPEVDLPVGELSLAVRVKSCANCELTSTSHPITVRREGEDAVVSYTKRSATIGDSLVLRVRDPRKQAAVAEHTEGDERYVMLRARPELPKAAQAYRPRTWVILDDVSASRGPMELRAQADLVDGFLRELDEDDRVAVIAFDVAARQKLGMTRVRDVDRPAVRRALKDEGGVGATSFGAALDAATKLLTGVAPEDARVVYIGDGVITSGARNLDALRAQLAGRAQFIGVGVGDGPDTQTLEALAAATGGYATLIDLADDVRWRAFDLVAALHTPRVTGLAARLVDASGALVPAASYARSPQLADGEELELVAKLAGGGTPVAVELTGVLAGAPWRQRIELAGGAQRPGGYLPRLWAHRHIAARLLAKHEPVEAPPCAAPDPGQRATAASTDAGAGAGMRGRRGPVPAAAAAPTCITEAEARAKRDEAIRQEVVALGKRYFLLSRHTSLLVLEDDAMYKRYGVTKGAGDTWAPYAVPAKIPVVKTAAVTDITDDAELVRSPLPVFADYSYRSDFEAGGWGSLGGEDDFGISLPRAQTEARFAARTRGSLGLLGGKSGGDFASLTGNADFSSGFDSNGSGTGTGYGTIGTGRFGTIGHGAGGGGRGIAAGPAPSMDRLSRDDVDERNEDKAAAADPAQPPPPPVSGSFAEAAKREEPEAARRRVVTTAELTNGIIGHGSGRGFGGLTKASKPSVGRYERVRPMRFTDPSDASFADLTAFVPALFPDGFDAWRSALGAGEPGEPGKPGKPHPIDDAAKALLARARAAVPAGIYRWGERELAVDGARRIGWRRTTGADLAETASFDGKALTRRYAELGLDVVRAVSDDDVALALAYLPLWIAEPAHYARYFAVRAAGPRRVALALPPKPGAQQEEVALVLDFDAEDRLVSITTGAGAELVRILWTGAGPSAARIDGEAVPVGFTGQAIADAAAWAHGAAAPGVTVELPGRLPAYWGKKLEQLTAGTAEWRHAQRQRMVALAAVGDRTGLFLAYEALRKQGGVLRGDLVLAGSGIVIGTRDEQVAAALAPHRAASPELAGYLDAGRAYASRRSAEALKSAQPGQTAGLVGALWSLREIAAHASAGAAGKAADRLVAMGQGAFDLRLIGAGVIGLRSSDRPEDVARAWDAVAQGEYRNIARAQAAQALANYGRYDAAAARVAALVADLDLRAAPPALGQLQYGVSASRRGNAGWQLVLSQWRDKVLAGDSYEHVMAMLPFAQRQAGDLQAILSRAVQLAGDDRDRLTDLALRALGLGQAPLAQRIIDPLVKQRPTRELHQLAARLAQAQGRTADALAHLEAAQDTGADEAVGLSTVRAELGAIIALARQLAVQSPAGSPAQRQAVARALAWGSRWRVIDPGNATIDQTLGEIMFAVGDTAEAWRQLSSVIERDPMSGDGYQTVAGVFEQQGRVAEALEYWQQAVVIDQTNPTPRLRKAQALIALGRTEEGDRLLAEIAGRRWHERHEWIVEQARSLLERGRRQGRSPDEP